MPLAACAAPQHAFLAPVDQSNAGQAAEAYLMSIAALDDAGPKLNAVIVTNKRARAQARAAAAAGLPLAGRTVLVKDNIETSEWPTTAGSPALADNATGRDAPLVARLRAAGGVVLGKTNLSEWANIRSSRSSSGWSAVGGQTRNRHTIDRNTCGSSSGSGAAVRRASPGRRSAGDGRLHHLPGQHRRHRRLQAHGRPCQPDACRADQPQSGYSRGRSAT